MAEDISIDEKGHIPLEQIIDIAITHLMEERESLSKDSKKEVYDCLVQGILKGVKATNYNLYALSAQEERVLATINRARREIPGDMELKLVAVSKRNQSQKIINPNTGRVANEKDKKLIITP